MATFIGITTWSYGNFHWNNYMILWATFIGITTRFYGNFHWIYNYYWTINKDQYYHLNFLQILNKFFSLRTISG